MVGRTARWALPLAAATLIAPLGALAPEREPAAEASRVAARYIEHLSAGRPFAAVDDCFDPASFDRRLFGPDIDALAPDKAAYLAQLTSILVKNTIAASPPELYSPQAEKGPLSAFRDA